MEYHEAHDKTDNAFDFFVQWHLTERCNLACSHCYQDDKTSKEMALPEIKRTIKHVSDTIRIWSDLYEIPFATSFSITGGEPLLRNDLPEILRSVVQNDISVSILTNGTLIKKEDALMFARVPVTGVQVSLEGPEPIHEAIRGKKSFSAALRGVQHLCDAGIRVTLNVTLSEINADYLQDMVPIAQKLGVSRLGFSRLVPYGRGFTLLSKMLEKERLKTLYGKILSMDTPGLEIVTGDPVASQMGVQAVDDGLEACMVGGCAAGFSGLTLLPDGTIFPCRRLRIPIGNILKDSLREIWAASDVLNALRDKSAYNGKCGTCGHWSKCRGCRAIAYAYSLSLGNNDFLAEDPQCFID